MKRENFGCRIIRIFEEAGYKPAQMMCVTPEEMVEIPGITVPNIRAVLFLQHKFSEEKNLLRKKIRTACENWVNRHD